MTSKQTELEKLAQIQSVALDALSGVVDLDALEAWRVTHLGRSSAVMAVFSSMGSIDKELRPLMGKAANEVRQALEAALEEKRQTLEAVALKQSLEVEKLDITLPGRPVTRGRLHPLTQVLRQITQIFGDMGFQVYPSPEVETDDFNFTYLNMPPYHPARDMWDTFYTTKDGVLLRTHTSPGQIRVMRARAPEPIRVILPGATMRYEQLSARSEIEFVQVEVLVVGKQVSFAEMKGTLDDFARRLFGEDARTRLRPSHFPFTEPSAELDVGCFVCNGEGCPVCKETGWLEILGCGMVHPLVLEYGGYDPTIYSGFAAGMGVDRSTLMRYRIDDIRHFRNNDVRFLKQF
ncbi:MAG TPA: phenylalanine--tRNA ligase subunit alpha [Brevefilum fermentans]|jgi:phenylalanyl-tRNA synthetase alpha chain|uniref:Phenylalanine--tRNA ligase alpha subunit n=1 Tax=Candidatus Brevifilum fermentans TaxID=1986204 RepID=A0A1Y6K8A1_9CHLR|nr:phenylalanine--tRNA ligase subunit alpha [Brevefilum fermentans]MDI9566625.1 phenylalanine--tRNA ligase subunit alpha [Chloroflexota bacterium]OQB86792.1 MAG: Phenylalanine--tRNA ligase alpha subunit [Chloroflexi bacterium ADurb.Bin120]SMX55047.1 phenylalanine tRNA synthetase, alpha subunit [Brevefilum fermentans]HOM66612.1 phenylalanine--tRNA ligase subunit alpha [Brevefilum fermentans]HPX96104.1 phenylalanine--tRNA ligase subunit alpha [Brevefilum fermentans]